MTEPTIEDEIKQKISTLSLVDDTAKTKEEEFLYVGPKSSPLEHIRAKTLKELEEKNKVHVMMQAPSTLMRLYSAFPRTVFNGGIILHPQKKLMRKTLPFLKNILDHPFIPINETPIRELSLSLILAYNKGPITTAIHSNLIYPVPVYTPGWVLLFYCNDKPELDEKTEEAKRFGSYRLQTNYMPFISTNAVNVALIYTEFVNKVTEPYADFIMSKMEANKKDEDSSETVEKQEEAERVFELWNEVAGKIMKSRLNLMHKLKIIIDNRSEAIIASAEFQDKLSKVAEVDHDQAISFNKKEGKELLETYGETVKSGFEHMINALGTYSFEALRAYEDFFTDYFKIDKEDANCLRVNPIVPDEQMFSSNERVSLSGLADYYREKIFNGVFCKPIEPLPENASDEDKMKQHLQMFENNQIMYGYMSALECFANSLRLILGSTEFIHKAVGILYNPGETLEEFYEKETKLPESKGFKVLPFDSSKYNSGKKTNSQETTETKSTITTETEKQ